jgi:hypothetical protein
MQAEENLKQTHVKGRAIQLTPMTITTPTTAINTACAAIPPLPLPPPAPAFTPFWETGLLRAMPI